jgi:hypothetical protein
MQYVNKIQDFEEYVVHMKDEKCKTYRQKSLCCGMLMWEPPSQCPQCQTDILSSVAKRADIYTSYRARVWPVLRYKLLVNQCS